MLSIFGSDDHASVFFSGNDTTQKKKIKAKPAKKEAVR